MSYGRRNTYGGGRGYGGRGQSNFGSPKPVEIGKEYDVNVTEITQRGDGVARIQGFVVFVRNVSYPSYTPLYNMQADMRIMFGKTKCKLCGDRP
jgi:hypothetical protein